MGRYWDDFEVGQEFLTPGRTITEGDVVSFAGLSGDLNPLHTDVEYCRRLGLPGLLPQTNLLISVASGLISRLGLFDGTGVGLVGMEWRAESPIEVGETVRCRVRIAELTEVSSEVGLLVREVEVIDRHDRIVLRGTQQVTVRRR